MLENRAQRLGVASNIIFHNRFVSREELTRFLAAADIYITPYLKPEQITSGTLAYAIGSGKAVISTPYWYASELLADGRGILVPWRDSQSIAEEVSGLLGDAEKIHSLGARAAAYGRDMGCRQPWRGNTWILSNAHISNVEPYGGLLSSLKRLPCAPPICLK